MKDKTLKKANELQKKIEALKRNIDNAEDYKEPYNQHVFLNGSIKIDRQNDPSLYKILSTIIYSAKKEELSDLEQQFANLNDQTVEVEDGK